VRSVTLCSPTPVGILLQEYLHKFRMFGECLQISGQDDLQYDSWSGRPAVRFLVRTTCSTIPGQDDLQYDSWSGRPAVRFPFSHFTYFVPPKLFLFD